MAKLSAVCVVRGYPGSPQEAPLTWGRRVLPGAAGVYPRCGRPAFVACRCARCSRVSRPRIQNMDYGIWNTEPTPKEKEAENPEYGIRVRVIDKPGEASGPGLQNVNNRFTNTHVLKAVTRVSSCR